MNNPMYLCSKCAEEFETAYILAEQLPLPGIPYKPTSRPCENCKKKCYGTYYHLLKREK